MLESIKRQMIVFFIPLLLLFGLALVPVPTYAASASVGEACSGLTQLPDGSCDNNGSAAVKIANQAVKLLSILAGIIAVVMIIVAGFQYITAGGDSGKLGKARSALIYTIISLFILGIAQFLVHVVLTVTK